jgi:peptide deformylase
MAVLKVLEVPNPVLRQTSVNVETFDEGLSETVKNMLETMFAYEGVGLAAPQVGILKRLLVIVYKGQQFVMVNPVIIETGGEIVEEMEACLSVPGKQGPVKRPDFLIMEYQNLTGERVRLEETGFLTRVIQHEMDHLNGVIYIDKATNLEDVV